MMDVKHLPIFIEASKLPEDVLRIIKHVREDWNQEDVKFKVFTDGITNKLIGCYHINEPKNIILVRVYGEKTDLFISRAMEVKNFKLMSSKGYAPTLFATFDNGMVYEYIHGKELDIHLCRDIALYPLVAKMLAKMHKLRYTDDTNLVPTLWNKCECFIDLISDTYPSQEKQSSYNTNFPGGRNTFRAELKHLRSSLENVDNPIVFCHNDLLLANVIHDSKSVWFIDYEYAGYNYQAYDIANHFAEFAGVTDYDNSLFPGEELRIDWIRQYLQEYCDREVTVDEDAIRRLHDNVCKFVPVAHFFWTMWSLMQATYSSIEFDYFNYAISRYSEYKKSLKSLGP